MLSYFDYKNKYYSTYILTDLLECFVGEDKTKSEEAFEILRSYLVKVYNVFLEIGERYKFCAKEVWDFPETIKGYIVESIEFKEVVTKKENSYFKVHMFHLDTASGKRDELEIIIPFVWASSTVEELEKFETLYLKRAKLNFIKEFILPIEKQYDEVVNEFNVLFSNKSGNRYTRIINCPRE